MNSGVSDPFELLIQIEQTIRQTARKLPRTETPSRWVGIGFELMGFSLLAPLTSVEEVLHYPRLTPIPQAKKWLKGVTNLRGIVLPVTDVAALLEHDTMTPSQFGKVLVIRQEEEYFGLLVTRVMGLKRFAELPNVTTNYPITGPLQPFIQGYFKEDDGNYWYLLDLAKIIQLKCFYETAAEVVCAV